MMTSSCYVMLVNVNDTITTVEVVSPLLISLALTKCTLCENGWKGCKLTIHLGEVEFM